MRGTAWLRPSPDRTPIQVWLDDLPQLAVTRVPVVDLLGMFLMKRAAPGIMTMDPMVMVSPMSRHPDIFVAQVPVDRALVIGLIADSYRDADFTVDWTEEHSDGQQAGRNQACKLCFHNTP